jgi:hypothetical protein
MVKAKGQLQLSNLRLPNLMGLGHLQSLKQQMLHRRQKKMTTKLHPHRLRVNKWLRREKRRFVLILNGSMIL